MANASVETLPIPKGITIMPPSALASSGKGKGRAAGEDVGGRKEGRIIGMKGTYLEVLQNHDNIAPILDAALADIDRSGQVGIHAFSPHSISLNMFFQPQVITCSGSHNTGSLRIIRTEADFKEQARLEGLPGITDIWPVKTSFIGLCVDNSAHKCILLTLITESTPTWWCQHCTRPSCSRFLRRM